MIVIADSGSTKTAWRFLFEDGTIEQFESLGLNPYYLSETRIVEELNKTPLPGYVNKDVNLYFYGSGLANADNKNILKSSLLKILPNATVEIHDDMLGAARATCEHQQGIACILGTGSNTCFYDGEKVADNIPSSGFILGDEGSGSYMGKMLLGDFIRNQLPNDIREKLEKRFDLSRDIILENVYRQPQANRYMAQFARFIFQHLNDPYCAALAHRAFKDFFEKYILHYPQHKDVPVHFVGSVGFYFSDLVRKTAKSYGVRVKNILENPIAGLTLYHQN